MAMRLKPEHLEKLKKVYNRLQDQQMCHSLQIQNGEPIRMHPCIITEGLWLMRIVMRLTGITADELIDVNAETEEDRDVFDEEPEFEQRPVPAGR